MKTARLRAAETHERAAAFHKRAADFYELSAVLDREHGQEPLAAQMEANADRERFAAARQQDEADKARASL